MFSEPFKSETVEINVFEGISEAEVVLTEGGSIEIELEREIEITPPEGFTERFTGEERGKLYTFEGTNSAGHSIKFFDTSYTPKISGGSSSIVDITPSTILFDSSDNRPIVDKRATVEIDLMNFSPLQPHREGVTEVDLLNRNDFSLSISTLDDLNERVDYIKEYRRSLRTGSIQVTQQANGPPERQLDMALDSAMNVLELISFIQGVRPSPIRARVISVSGEAPEFECEKWVPVYKETVGHAFKGERIVWAGDTQRFLDEAYGNYVDNFRDKYRLNMVIDWYLDALLGGRSIESQFASICSGIELLAKRHSDLGPEYSETEDRIIHLVDKLDVEVRDLAEFSESYEDSKLDDEDCANEYFYYKTRQYVMHGDNLSTSFDERYKDYISGLILFQRLLRNQLIGTKNLDEYSALGDLEVEDTRYE